MDDREDPISQFFPGNNEVDLYDVLSVKSDATSDQVKKAYRRLALTYHPDKHATASDSAKGDASLKFQQVGFAYAVLFDEKRRKRYDLTGKTDEGLDLAPGEDGWDAYFEDLFESVTREKLDEHKNEYQGSAEEVEDIRKAYHSCKGAIGEIMKHIPHSTHDDEARFVLVISDLIRNGELSSLPKWESSSKDEKARLVRKKQSDKEAKEAEELAKELGLWEDFYGSGKPSSKKGKRKGKGKQQDEDEDGGEDHSALQALILKRKKNVDGFLDSLAAKYAEPERGANAKKGSKRRDGPVDDEESPKKKTKKSFDPPDIDDEEFEKLQQKLFADRPKGGSAPGEKGRKAKAEGWKAR
ncbi:DnaJ-domain-containing protein [Sparassis latifolia]